MGKYSVLPWKEVSEILPTGRQTTIAVLRTLEGAARYASLLLAPAEGFGLRPRRFFALGANTGLLYLFWPKCW